MFNPQCGWMHFSLRKLCSQLAPFTSEESQAAEHYGSSHAFAEAAHRLWSWESQTELIEEHGGVSLTSGEPSISPRPAHRGVRFTRVAHSTLSYSNVERLGAQGYERMTRMERNLANYIFAPETMSGKIEVGGQSICSGQSNWQSFAHHGNTASVPADLIKDLDQGEGLFLWGSLNCVKHQGVLQSCPPR